MDTEDIRSLPSPLPKPPPGGRGRDGAKTALPPALQSLEINVVPDEVEMTLQPPAGDQPGARPRPMYHRVTPKPGALVSLWSRDDRLHVVRLSVRSGATGWGARWARWVFAVRQTPKDLGGDALAAQDTVSPDGSEMTLLVLPGEHRTVTLEFDAALDGQTYPGDYEFDIVMTDTEDGAQSSAPGLLRLRHPAARLLNYLPAIYTQPTERAGRYGPYEDSPFFERFLRGFEDAMAPTGEMLSEIADYFDADTAPAEFLPWLGTWVALILDENWPGLKRRLLIKEAVELYRWRGTRHGLMRYLEIYAGVAPQINDQPFRGMRLGPNTLLGRDARLGDVPPHTFVVTLAVPDPRTVNEQTVRDIIESEKPAHAAYELRIVAREADGADIVLAGD